MWILIIGLIVLTAIAMAVGYARNKKIQKKIESGELQAAPEIVEADAECCGQHEICEKESLLAAVSKKVEYYDDEELDRFRGHSSDGYSEEEIEEFREVMYTCKEDEVAGWSRSLQLPRLCRRPADSVCAAQRHHTASCPFSSSMILNICTSSPVTASR